MTRMVRTACHDGRQILVTVWPDGEIEIAERDNEWDGWSPPLEVTGVDTS